MRKINILTKSVYNRIAAGEVVDRPYSVVKEMIENSLDAGADEIEIYIERGGKQLIKVVDNGSGIERDDLRAAFFPHATSKISSADDLEKITTLGFRGEALASISAVSKVEIVSATEGNPAFSATCDGGKMGEILPAAREKGTSITVRDLFFNTPARAKFMKPDKKEESDITNFVSRYILSRPNVAFRYYTDGKLVLQSFGGGLEEALTQVYGAKTLAECYCINAEKDGVKIYGYIGNRNFFKPNKGYQSTFLNGRYIVNNTLATALSTAYASYAMKRQYPFYVLFIDVPTDIVDVNVHPNKADVRFIDNKFIFGIVYSVVSAVLDGTSKAVDFIVEDKRIPEVKSTFTPSRDEMAGLIEKYKPEIKETPKITPPVEEKVERAEIPKNTERKYFDPTVSLPITEFLDPPQDGKMKVSDDTQYSIFPTAEEKIQKEYDEIKQERINYESCIYKGNLFNTYLLYEYRDSVYCIDQHAAHERLIYDSLRKKIAERKIVMQGLLFPYIFDASPSEALFIENKLDVLRAIGFGIEPFGVRSYRVDEVPVDLQDINIKEFFNEILSDVDELKDIKLEEILKDKLAMTACKHAVKGGMELTDAEIDSLFKMLKGDMGLKCPHGRPICVKVTKTQIEKAFKRIV